MVMKRLYLKLFIHDGQKIVLISFRKNRGKGKDGGGTAVLMPPPPHFGRIVGVSLIFREKQMKKLVLIEIFFEPAKF